MAQANAKIQRFTLIMVLLNAFTTPLMLSAVNVALPAIARDLSLDAVTLSWVPMAYLMASAIFVLIFGRLADMYGRKRIFLAGTVCVIVTSLLATVAMTGPWLLLARFLQGVSAAMLYATQIALVSSVLPPAKRGHAIGLTVSMIYLGLTGGPLIGGYLVDLFGWRASFILHIPLAFIVLLIGLTQVPVEWSADEKGQFDGKGAILYGVTIALFCLGISTLPNLFSYACIVVAAVTVTWFLAHVRNKDHPIFNVSLFYSNRLFSFSCLVALIIYTATYANVVLISLYLQYIKAISATVTGLIMMVQPLTMAIVSPVAGRLSDRIEPRIIATLGTFLTAFGLLLLALMDINSSVAYIIIALAVTGLGFSLFSPANANAIMSAVAKPFYGSAAGSIATVRILGQMSSMALVTLVFVLIIGAVEITPAIYSTLFRAIKISFAVAAILCIPGLLFSLIRGRMH